MCIRDSNKNNYIKNRGYKKANHKGFFDGLANKAEESSSFLTRTKIPPNYSLNRILGLAEQAQMYEATTEWEKRQPQEEFEASRNKCLDRIWDAYQLVQERELMHKNAKGKDESWNGAKQDPATKKYVAEPIYYYGDHFEYVMGDELHGNKAQGRTPIRDSNYNGEEKGEDE